MAQPKSLSAKVWPLKRTKTNKTKNTQKSTSPRKKHKIGADAEFDGPFRSNVSLFLNKYGSKMPSPMTVLRREDMLPCIMTWVIMLEIAGAQVTMHVIEEDVRRSRSVYCENCKVAGEADCFLCRSCSRKIYHKQNYELEEIT